MRYGSLFSGAGGLDLAIEEVFGAECAWQCEYDAAASKVLAAHWPDVPNLHDVTTVDWSTVDPIDILCGGFPCQDVSVAGLRVGIAEGTRSGLWAMFTKAIAALRPKFVVIENVRGLHSAEAHRGVESADATVGDGSDGSVLRATGAVLGDLAELGYDAQWVTVSAASVGAPHERFRVFILATDASSERRTDIARFCSAGRQSIVTEPGAGDRDRGRDCSAGVRQFRRTAGELAPVDLLPTPAAADADRGPDFARAGREGSGGDDLVTLCARATRGIGTRWGKYEPAISRWEQVTRPAPSPTEPNTKGNPRLAPVFPEWMMGWPDGWVTAVPGVSRNDQLRIIGNGVVTLQAVAALRWLLTVSEAAA